MIGAVRPGVGQVQWRCIRAEQIRQPCCGSPDFGAPVLRGLDDVRVQAEQYVVDENPAVDAGQIYAALDSVSESVQRAGHVVAIQAQIKGEMVAGAGWHADKRDVMARGNGGHEGL